MISWLKTIIFGSLAALGFWLYGRKTKENDVLKQDVQAKKETNEILQAQRDNRINTVDDADKLFDNIKG